MANEGKRIFQYPEVTTLTDDDYALIDNRTGGPKSIKAKKLAPSLMSKTITERGTYKASDDGVRGYNEVNVNIPYTDIHVATGPIATFEGEDLPLKSLTASIVPVQDLHGYDSPWAGGAGKNLFNMGSKLSSTASGLTFTTDDNYININGTKNGANYVTPTQLYFDLPAGTYYAKAFVISGTTSNAPSVYVYSNQELTSNMMNTERSFTIESQTSVGIRFAFWNDGATFNNYKLGIVISKTANIDKFYPYSNICPISGWTEEVVSVRGVNQWDEQWELGYIDGANGQPTAEFTSIRSKNFNRCVPNANYYGFTNTTSASSAYYIYWYDADKNYISRNNIGNTTVVMSPSNAMYFKIACYHYGTTYNNDISINYPSTDTEYHAYAGTTTTIPFTDSQGQSVEVFGGSVDVVNGGGQRTVAKEILDENTGWSISYNAETGIATFYTDGIFPSTKYKDSSKNLCNIAKWINRESGSLDANTWTMRSYNKRFYIAVTGFTTLEEWKTYLASNPIVICAELTNPTTFYTQPTSIKSLDGDNNVFASTGDVDVEYQTVWVRPTE